MKYFRDDLLFITEVTSVMVSMQLITSNVKFHLLFVPFWNSHRSQKQKLNRISLFGQKINIHIVWIHIEIQRLFLKYILFCKAGISTAAPFPFPPLPFPQAVRPAIIVWSALDTLISFPFFFILHSPFSCLCLLFDCCFLFVSASTRLIQWARRIHCQHRVFLQLPFQFLQDIPLLVGCFSPLRRSTTRSAAIIPVCHTSFKESSPYGATSVQSTR